ncbi:MAG: hypothetical protein ACO1O3_08130 [Sphingobium sp.]
MRIARWACGAMLALLAGCGGGAPVRPVAAPVPPPSRPVPIPTAGLERVMGQTAKSLTSMFGRPDQDVREANGRKLQFGSGVCVLDAYLYARRNGQEPGVTYVDARQLDGSDIDRASCVASFTRR